MGPSNRCRRGAGVRMGGQMPHRQPNQVSGPSVRRPMAVQHGVTRGKGRIANNNVIDFFLDMQT